MIEGEVGAQRFPAFSGVTRIAGDIQFPMRTGIIGDRPIRGSEQEQNRSEDRAARLHTMIEGTHFFSAAAAGVWQSLHSIFNGR